MMPGADFLQSVHDMAAALNELNDVYGIQESMLPQKLKTRIAKPPQRIELGKKKTDSQPDPPKQQPKKTAVAAADTEALQKMVSAAAESAAQQAVAALHLQTNTKKPKQSGKTVAATGPDLTADDCRKHGLCLSLQLKNPAATSPREKRGSSLVATSTPKNLCKKYYPADTDWTAVPRSEDYDLTSK